MAAAPPDTLLEFPPSHRLRKRREFEQVMQKGARRFTPSFIFFLKRTDLSHPRLGVTVTKKVGNAVLRNRVKRLVREAFRLHPEVFRFPLDVVVVAKREMPAQHLADVVKEFRHVLRKYFDERGKDARPPGAGSAPAR